jgi:quercetin dioxygenase-like cupin family protein
VYNLSPTTLNNFHLLNQIMPESPDSLPSTNLQSSKTFYDGWLGLWDKGEKEKKTARVALYPEELMWVTTAQDAKAALLVAPENNFRTSGSVSMIADIPPGYHTGTHSHGEEAMYILEGEGNSIINNRKYEWEKGACIRIPFGAIHRHVNTSDTPVRYYSVMAPYFESLALVAKFEQFERFGKNSDSKSASVERSDDGFDIKGRKLVLRLAEAKITLGGEDSKEAPRTAYKESIPKEMYEGQGHHSRTIRYMGSRPDFMGEEVEITSVLCFSAETSGGKHAHMEAILYVIQGEGYTLVNDTKIPWRPGTALHIPGPQTPHQHYNTGKVEAQFIRAHSSIRYKLFQPIAKEKFPYLYLEHRPPEKTTS